MVPSDPERDPRDGVPLQLQSVLAPQDPRTRDQEWTRFLDRYSRLILRAVRRFGRDHDAAMDRYAYVIEQLRQDDFRRLRAYSEGRGQFSTWLTVVVRRLCLDFHRQRYGRPRGPPGTARADYDLARRRLVDLITADFDVDDFIASGRDDPERSLRRSELHDALHTAVRSLAARDRLLLALRFEDGRTARDIADVMGFPTAFHVYRRVNSLLAGLRRALEQHGFRDPAP